MGTTGTTGMPGALSHRQVLTAISGLLLASLLAALDQTIVSTAMRTIADQLHGQTVQAWAITGYLVSSTIAMPFYGKLSDIYGRKPLYLAAIAVFILGSAACGMSTSMEALAVSRVVQGLGGAGLMSLPTAVIADMVPVRERARYFTYAASAWVVAGLLGPLVGGYFASARSLLGTDGWRWAFLINIPLGLLALLTVYRSLRLRHRRVDHRLDFGGAAALTLGLVPLLIVVERGTAWGWGSANAIVLYALSAVGLVSFLVIERRIGARAMLPLALFGRGGIGLPVAVNFTTGVGMLGTVTAFPLYLQLVQGRSATDAGLFVLPLMIGAILAQGFSGKVIKATGHFKPLAIAGSGSMAGALLLMATVDAVTPWWANALLALWTGLGIGMAITVITLAIQNAAPHGDLGAANGAGGMVRQLGGTFGVAALLSILFSVTSARMGAVLRDAGPGDPFRRALADPAVLADPANRALVDLVNAGNGTGINLDDVSFLSRLDPRLARPLLDSFATGAHWMFLVAGLILAAGFAMTWFLKDLGVTADQKP
ncbi:MDR family MFS transporter [Pseudonocardia acaciae]|uniref:MDR family MFS transporter n=1 Tax=Pseudonocardia acaciae TaxID=551276 RepID=UPI00055B7E87|nr:MDR family MFS transporter [Pseudonocardia acaciae]